MIKLPQEEVDQQEKRGEDSPGKVDADGESDAEFYPDLIPADTFFMADGDY